MSYIKYIRLPCLFNDKNQTLSSVEESLLACNLLFKNYNKTDNAHITLKLRSVRVAIFAVSSNKYYIFRVWVWSLSYPACKAHAPHYIAICGSPGLPYFSTIPRKLRDFQNKQNKNTKIKKKYVIEQKYEFLFSLQYCLKHFSF